ncbi:lysine--tRNA ligase [Nocardioides sp. MAH-18]|uniref:Lysine--tRNA ligase n=1 Tax=Nocardioides agri TaxID=2682843 RepID=A0A6L6XSU2_9ACTN|nr:MULTISPECIES: lysine--tRNA ligase [unclassified Nocardioides]MBA2954680.1 lysine--tRNA ligase [Nocardioides sp. CGMCC 1.13656]MVQ49536.1 lysine--tRNA ligase [Nocardioides sp. MAH-18]
MARGAQSGEPHDWVTRAADDAIRHAHDTHGEDRVITCASGASPSGPIHLGNLREFITPHFVAEEIRRRGLAVRHLHSWDDYDRFRKVPAGVDPSWAEHIGRPLSAVPDPWACHPSWAEHFKAPLRAALAEMGIEMEEVSQTEQYASGAYTEQVLHAIRHRDVIEEVLGKHRTKKAEPENEQEAAALEDSVVEDEDEPAGTGDLARFPYKPYCRECGRDTVEITAYDDETTDLSYTCSACGFTGVTNVATQHEGKLVWKVDWPMRWAYEGVDFEPGGLDHSTPGSSYTVGKELVKRVFDFRAPSYVAYAFVGFAGVQKMSSSAGGVPTAADALRILEAPILRWLYVRRQPKQAFNIDFGAEVVRLYDEWDALGRKAAEGTKRDAQVLAFERASSTASAGRLPTPRVVVSFRLLSSVADVTAGSAELISRIVADVGYAHDSVDDLQPRLGRAMAWMSDFVPAEERTTVRERPDAERLASLSEDEEIWLRQLLDRMPDHLELDATTELIYGVPKLARGLGLDDAPTDQVKQDQKDFFRLLYNLLVDADRGPRLPTLFLALGAEKVRSLLTPPA